MFGLATRPSGDGPLVLLRCYFRGTRADGELDAAAKAAPSRRWLGERFLFFLGLRRGQ